MGGGESHFQHRNMTRNEEIALAAGADIITVDQADDLEEWDIGEYKKDARLMVVLGKRNTGKTVFTLNFCYHNRDIYPYVFVVTKTAFNNFWSQYVPEHMIVDSFDPKMIENIFLAQQDRVLQPSINSRILIIFDDMV